VSPEASKLAMKKLNDCFVGLVMIAASLTCTLTLTSCSDDDKNEPDNTGVSSARIVGVWEGVADTEYDFMKYDEDNTLTMYEIGLENGVAKAYASHEHYTYDADNGLLIIHYNYNDDADIYKVDMLTDTRLVYSWIDDISDRYSGTNYYSKAKDLEICREYAERDYTVDDIQEKYVRTTEDALPKNVEIATY